MSRITLDTDLRNKLGDLTQLIELCDETGRVVSQIVPAPASRYDLPFSNEELRRIAAETTEWYSTEQVLDHLRKVGGP